MDNDKSVFVSACIVCGWSPRWTSWPSILDARLDVFTSSCCLRYNISHSFLSLSRDELFDHAQWRWCCANTPLPESFCNVESPCVPSVLPHQCSNSRIRLSVSRGLYFDRSRKDRWRNWGFGNSTDGRRSRSAIGPAIGDSGLGDFRLDGRSASNAMVPIRIWRKFACRSGSTRQAAACVPQLHSRWRRARCPLADSDLQHYRQRWTCAEQLSRKLFVVAQGGPDDAESSGHLSRNDGGTFCAGEGLWRELRAGHDGSTNFHHAGRVYRARTEQDDGQGPRLHPQRR